ncbi:urocortin-3-like [Betta splendens]|uniref:Urocortin-3-like n=1 Tax=Betta splendens TaxID=158456 RepID=A0A6P7MPV3_BETSP|nr:urocortin-3-like [Betta splendens]
MRSVYVCFCLALLLPRWVPGQRSSGAALARLHEDARMDALAADLLSRGGALNSLLQSEQQRRPAPRGARAPRPAAQVPKRAQQGSRFALSLDVPTSILSVLIDLAKNQDMRTKAAANAELMARIGKRK